MQDQPKTDTVTHRQVDLPTQAPLDWRAIVAGALGAAAISALLLGFGSAIGLSLTSAQPYAGLSATSLSILLAVWLAIVHVGSFERVKRDGVCGHRTAAVVSEIPLLDRKTHERAVPACNSSASGHVLY